METALDKLQAHVEKEKTLLEQGEVLDSINTCFM